MAVVGGLARVWGAVVGAVFVQALGEVLNRGVPLLVEGAAGEYQLIGFGLVLTAVVVLLPGGIVPAVRRGRTAGPAPAGPGAPDLQAAAGAAMPARPGRPGPGTPVLEVAGARRGFGGVVAVDGVDLVVRGGELVALIGPNGAGKSTLLDIVSGVAPAGGGTVRVRGQPVRGGRPDRAVAAGVARTFQHLEVFASLSALGNVKVGRHLRSGAGMVAGALRVPARAEEREIEASARRLLGLLGLAAVAGVPAAELPFGQQRLVEVARALATEPDLLLLDEPMAGLSAAERAGLVRLLRGLADGGMALLVVEHDVDAVMAMADRVAVLDEGRLIALGPPAQVRADPAVLEAYLGGELEVARP
jgi:branched-chain amino acid transport system permease protein